MSGDKTQIDLRITWRSLIFPMTKTLIIKHEKSKVCPLYMPLEPKSEYLVELLWAQPPSYPFELSHMEDLLHLRNLWTSKVVYSFASNSSITEKEEHIPLIVPSDIIILYVLLFCAGAVFIRKFWIKRSQQMKFEILHRYEFSANCFMAFYPFAQL